jgi:hypothetical protein
MIIFVGRSTAHISASSCILKNLQLRISGVITGRRRRRASRRGPVRPPGDTGSPSGAGSTRIRPESIAVGRGKGRGALAEHVNQVVQGVEVMPERYRRRPRRRSRPAPLRLHSDRPNQGCVRRSATRRPCRTGPRRIPYPRRTCRPSKNERSRDVRSSRAPGRPLGGHR